MNARLENIKVRIKYLIEEMDVDPELARAYNAGINKHIGKTDKKSIEKAGGDPETYSRLKQRKKAEFERNTAPVHYQKKDSGEETLRRDRKAGPKGHSRWNSFEKKGTAAAKDHPFASGKRKAAMSRAEINRKGIQGKTVTKDGQKIPADRWNAMRSALRNRKFRKTMANIPDGN